MGLQFTSFFFLPSLHSSIDFGNRGQALQGRLKIVAAKPSVWSVLRAPIVCQQAGDESS